jgi:hypothetical protein
MTDRVRALATIFGIGYLAAGVIGFGVTGFDGWVANGDDAILGFEINPFHNLFHVATGALWLLAARLPNRQSAEGVHQGIAIVYLLAVLLGGLGFLTMLSVDGATAADNGLHLVSGLAAGVAAFSERLPGRTARLAS